MNLNISELVFQRPTWAEINLDALSSNVLVIQKIASPARILAVVKSDGYGHGAVTVARKLQQDGVAYFGTATVTEAIELRNAGITIPVLVLSGLTPEQLPLLLQYDLIPAIYNMRFLKALDEYTRSQNKEVLVHVKVDTGVGRLGFTLSDAAEVLRHALPFVKIGGVYTHLACAEIPNDPYTQRQLALFRQFLLENPQKGPLVHAANSSAIVNYPESHYDMVRPGILLYGISPVDETLGLVPILTLKSKIMYMHWIQKGETVGYGRSFCAERDTLIATIPIGYADGLRRHLSNRLEVEIRGTMCPAVGNISMDLTTIDVTEIANSVQLYDTATLIGPRTTAKDWARLLDTVVYEVTCLIGARVPRVYYKNDQICDVYYP